MLIMRWRAFWWGFFHPVASPDECEKYAQKLATEYFKRINML